jgi:hypothetical protein
LQQKLNQLDASLPLSVYSLLKKSFELFEEARTELHRAGAGSKQQQTAAGAGAGAGAMVVCDE